MPQHLQKHLQTISNGDQDMRNTIRAMGKTVKGILLVEDDVNIRSMYYNIKGSKGVRHSLNIHGKLAGTGWKTTILLNKNDDKMISFEVNLPRGRHSYRTDILASLVTEDVVRAYAEHALVQLLMKNNREDVLTQLLGQKR